MRIGRLGLALCALVASVGVGTMRPADHGVEIGVGKQVLSPRSGAARVTEVVRYDDSDLTLAASYPVIDGELQLPADPGDDTPDPRPVWATVSALLPPDASERIRQLNLVSDGQAGTLAMVHRSLSEPDTWVLSVDYVETGAVLQRTIVHELAHLYTLGPDDVSGSRSGCSQMLLTVGCVRKGSILARYGDQFWHGRSEPAAFRPGQFVSQYAASSVHEDLAETFMAWVFGDALDGPALGARADFLAAEPTLAAARDWVRAALAQAGRTI